MLLRMLPEIAMMITRRWWWWWWDVAELCHNLTLNNLGRFSKSFGILLLKIDARNCNDDNKEEEVVVRR